MNMQDNELDQLFRHKLNGAEAEPSSRVWKGISAELGHEPKKSWAPVLRIAASVVVVLTAGIWFMLHQPEAKQQVAQNKPSGQQPIKATAPQSRLHTNPTVANDVTEQPAVVNTQQQVNQIAAAKRQVPIEAKHAVMPTKAIYNEQPAVTAPTVEQNPVLASVPNQQPVVKQPVLPEISLTGNTPDEAVSYKTPTVPVTVVASTEPAKNFGCAAIAMLNGSNSCQHSSAHTFGRR